MNTSRSKPRSGNRLLIEAITKVHRRAYAEFYEFLESGDRPKVLVELGAGLLDEATRSSVGRFTARRDQPHFAGDVYHGHCDVGGGHEVSWTVSGQRRHPSKFPATVPQDAKAAVAKVLGVSADILEAYWIEDGGDRVLLLESIVA
jgi:hypothetical protein